MRVEGKVVVVTGASSGIGRATAVQAAQEGAHVVLAARGERTLKDAAAECDEAGAASTLIVPTDVGDDEAVGDLVRRTLERHGRIDVVVSNAGVVSYGRAEDVPADVFDQLIRTNLLGGVNVARHVVPVLRSQEGGTLIFVGSVIGHITVPSMTAYTVSKWGLRALALQVRLENRDLSGVHIGYVAPGGVDTPIYQQAANYDGFEGRPPPPVASPQRVARQILRRVGHDRVWAQLTPANDVIRLGYVTMPLVYDALVGPLFRLLSEDLARPVAATAGNVLRSVEDGNQLTGSARPMVQAVAGNAATLMRRLTTRLAPGDDR
jgi:NAD(P)-dependent dehydrogenase (short-subunit alcohol dehydrogenase family)